MGLRGVFACAFIVSTGLLTGMAAVPSGAAASEPFAVGEAASLPQEGSVFERVKRTACKISLSASVGDRSAAQDRSRKCDH